MFPELHVKTVEFHLLCFVFKLVSHMYHTHASISSGLRIQDTTPRPDTPVFSDYSKQNHAQTLCPLLYTFLVSHTWTLKYYNFKINESLF